LASDGYNDSEELSGNTDPLNASDYPYTGGWPIDACRDTVVSTRSDKALLQNPYASEQSPSERKSF